MSHKSITSSEIMIIAEMVRGKTDYGNLLQNVT